MKIKFDQLEEFRGSRVELFQGHSKIKPPVAGRPGENDQSEDTKSANPNDPPSNKDTDNG